MTEKEIAAIRAYTIPISEGKKRPVRTNVENHPSFERVLVFDTETRTDLYQNMTFGYFTIYENNRLDVSGIFYDSITVTPKEQKILEGYSAQNNIDLYTLDEFRKVFLTEVFDLETLCVGFNLPFDITRIALRATEGKLANQGGFSMVISEEKRYPRLIINHVSSTLSFINWGSTVDAQKQYKLKNNENYFRGNFLDLRMSVHALTDEKHTLESACKAYKTKYQKQETKEYGKVTPEHIEYCIADVNATHSLYKNVKDEFETFKLHIPITKAYTPASIGKEFLKQMGMKSFKEKNPEFSDEIIGNTMTGYFGGRTECKIRKTPTKVDLLDFLSMYPTVCTLQGLWKFVIAESIDYKDATDEIRNFVDKFTLEDIQNKDNWKQFQAIVQVMPEDDVLPLRAQYGDKHAWNIGISSVTSKIPLWYSLADIIASKLYTGKTPKILKALRFVAGPPQRGLNEIDIHGIKIDPYSQDLFKELIQYRKQIQEKRDKYDKEDSEYKDHDRKQQVVKIITNAISYGIFVEITTLNRNQIPVDVHGLVNFQQKKDKIERPGFMFNPIIAVSITSASRLLLAATEVLLAKHGVTHAYCDTDSMAIPPQYTKEVQDFFADLNPYDFDADIFKIEKSNVWLYGISAKRYCLYTIDEKTGEIIIDEEKYSAHGLGHLLDPLSNYDDKKHESWHIEIWKNILDLEYKKTSIEKLYEKYDNKYAIQKLGISTPIVLNRIKDFNEGKDYHSQIKPSNFCIVGFSNMTNEETGEQIKPLAPFQKFVKDAVFDDFIDYNTQNSKKLRGKEYWKSFWDTFEEYLRHPESKFDGENGVLGRKHVFVTDIKHIGKESDVLNEPFGLDEFSYEFYDDPERVDREFKENTDKILDLEPKDVKNVGINRATLWNVKKKIKKKEYDHITDKIKIKILSALKYN